MSRRRLPAPKSSPFRKRSQAPRNRRRNSAGKGAPDIAPPPGLRAGSLRRGIARDPRHAVEVGVKAGNGGQMVLLHDSDDDRVAGEQTVLLAQERRRGDE